MFLSKERKDGDRSIQLFYTKRELDREHYCDKIIDERNHLKNSFAT